MLQAIWTLYYWEGTVMEITYHRKGDYLYPNLTLETDETLTIGKYGLLRKRYLKENKPH